MLAETLAAIRPADPRAIADARAYQDRLTKPRGSLGALEEVAVRLAGGEIPPRDSVLCFAITGHRDLLF